MHSVFSRSLLGAGLILWLGACSDRTGPEAEVVPVNADVALAVAEAVGEDVQTMRELGPRLPLGFLLLPLGHAVPPRECPYDPATGRHTCPEVTLPGGMVISRSYAFYDANGRPMESYDGQLTASINFFRSVQGSISRNTEHGSFSGSVSHTRNLTVSGLLGQETERTWNGTGSSSNRRSLVVDGRGSRSYELDADLVITNVVVPVTRGSDRDPWPLSGTIRIEVTGSVTKGEDTRTFERMVVVTFNGTQYAEATVNGQTFTIDLAARHARPGHPGR